MFMIKNRNRENLQLYWEVNCFFLHGGSERKITIDVLQSLVNEQSVPAITLFDPLDIFEMPT